MNTMESGISDNPLDRIPAYDRVSIRAVLVHGEEDPGPALAAAGITNPIAIPVMMSEDLDLSSSILGDGITPNLVGVLETEQQDGPGASPAGRPSQAGPRPEARQPG